VAAVHLDGDHDAAAVEILYPWLAILWVEAWE
jgi:hypothetical protein